ncbi:LysR family transcriptional regulator [Micromonospora endophytica]|uniref:LysR family transcriptional regulator n=1 Tax=Micromonospora endophytica TaxID=515350 RepID=UPI001C326325|nr:LysR family transcriptional regulator [Micromonospora endophytica]BCJ62978.1 hypothetical protein Jiend_64000 [Micromonospora endophytica]
MDLVAACRAFVSVGEHGSFTVGASVARIPQSVASRRVAALEQHLGGRLFDRTSRSVTLTPFGRDMLHSARRIVDLAEAMEHDAERARLRPFRLAVPAACAPRSLAGLVVEARRHELNLELRRAEPSRRNGRGCGRVSRCAARWWAYRPTRPRGGCRWVSAAAPTRVWR